MGYALGAFGYADNLDQSNYRASTAASAGNIADVSC
jgi:hypothetical protein